MRTGTLAFLLGVVCFQHLPVLPALGWTVLLIIIVPLCFRLRWPLYLPLAFGTGFLWSLGYAHWLLSPALAPELQGRDLQLEAVVRSLPMIDARATRFEVDVITLADERGAALPAPRRLRLSWYDAAPELAPGERWRLRVRLKLARGFANPGGFDYEAWLMRQGIVATGYVRAARDNQRLAESSGGYIVQRVRHALHARLRTLLAGTPEAGLVAALAIGERSGVSATQWQVLTRTGTSHLMAISGLHVGLVAGLVFWLLRWGWARLGRWAEPLPAVKAAAVGALAAAVGYAALAGFAVPTQRAVIMLAVVLTATLLQRRVLPSRALSAALLAVLLSDPLASLAPGFWLSFAAVAVLFSTALGAPRTQSWWVRSVRTQLALTIGLAPVLLVFFAQASLVSPLANLVAVPVVSLAVIPLTLFGALLAAVGDWPAQALLGAAAWILSWVMVLLSALAQGDWAVLRVGALGPVAVALALGGALLGVAPRGWPGRWLILPLLAPALLATHPSPGWGEAWVTVLDVGQGLAVVVRTREHTLVYDTGPRFSDNFDTGQAVVVPYLRHVGIAQLDALVISHGDNDHIGGAESVLEAFPVHRVWSSVAERLEGAGAQSCQAGQQWSWDGVRFQMLHPPRGSFANNDASCVLRIVTAHGVALLTGDIERAAERELVSRFGAALRADVMTAPHHGSRTSSSAGLLAAVKPRHVVVPAGYRNRYGFPHAEVVARYRAQGASIWHSARSGAITFRFAAEASDQPQQYRADAPRYWHRPGERPFGQAGSLLN